MEDKDHGIIDNWLRHIKDVSRFNAEKLIGLDEQERFDTLCELNVEEQVNNVCNTSIVQKVWRKGKRLTVHGWIYNIENGLLKSLGSIDSSGR